jgi:hypothetical protein
MEADERKRPVIRELVMKEYACWVFSSRYCELFDNAHQQL